MGERRGRGNLVCTRVVGPRDLRRDGSGTRRDAVPIQIVAEHLDGVPAGCIRGRFRSWTRPGVGEVPRRIPGEEPADNRPVRRREVRRTEVGEVPPGDVPEEEVPVVGPRRPRVADVVEERLCAVPRDVQIEPEPPRRVDGSVPHARTVRHREVRPEDAPGPEVHHDAHGEGASPRGDGRPEHGRGNNRHQDGRRNPAHLNSSFKQALYISNSLDRIKGFGASMQLLRDLREATTMLVLYSVTTERHTHLRSLADELGMTVQGASEYVRRMIEQGLLQRVDGEYRATKKGVELLLGRVPPKDEGGAKGLRESAAKKIRAAPKDAVIATLDVAGVVVARKLGLRSDIRYGVLAGTIEAAQLGLDVVLLLPEERAAEAVQAIEAANAKLEDKIPYESVALG